METCIENIKNKIVAVREESHATNLMSDDNDNANKILDLILGYQKTISNTTNSLDDLIEAVIEIMPNLKQDECYEVKLSLEEVNTISSKTYSGIRNSVAYSGVKSQALMYHQSINNLREVIDDIELFMIELPNDNEYKEFVVKLNNIIW